MKATAIEFMLDNLANLIRQLVGYSHGGEEREHRRYYMNEMNKILEMCETDPAMKDLLDKLFVMYNLKKDER